LYERWILASKPTGKIGYLTEQAIMKLQCVKWFKEYDKTNGIFVIWPKTIEEINKIKNKMKKQGYIKKTFFPNVDLQKCWETFQTRNKLLNKLIVNPPSRANNKYLNHIDPNYSINPEGEIKIIKNTIKNIINNIINR
jgi:aminopeptidase N